MTCWEILGLEPGAEPREIKRRFAQLVKVNRPEDDPVVYQRLRDAYEQALSSEENPIRDGDVWDDEEPVSKRATPTRIRFPTVNISARIHHQNPIVVSATLSWQSVLDDLFLVNESKPQQAEAQLTEAVARLSSSDLKARLQFEEHLALNLSRVFRPLLTLAAAEKFKWYLTSGGNHQAACCAINDKRTLWLLNEAEIAPLFFADMSAIDEIESGDRLKRIYQNYADDAENRPWFDAAVLMQIVRYDLSSAFLGFIVEKLEWSVKPDKSIRCWSLSERFHALEIIHPLGYEKLCAAISAADGVYHTSKTSVSYAKAAEQKHAISRYNLGLLYEQGEDVEQDDNRAFFWFSCAAKQGHADAQHSLGVCYREGKGTNQDFQQVIYWLMKSAVQENVYAQYDLGRIYICETSDMQDYVKAFYWFQKAAQQGFAHAQNHLGWLYYNETTGSRNYQQALRWFTLAAEQHCDVAQYNLGILYRDGLSGPINYQLAYDYFLKAARQGYAPAQNEVAMMYYHGRGIEQNYQMVIEWYSKSAEQGDAIAQYNLGQLYSDDEIMQPDYAKAQYWLMQSAEQEYGDAQFKLGFMYFEETGVPRDIQKSIFWFTAAGQQENVDAAVMLGKIYMRGEGIIGKDYSSSLFWYEKAAKLNHAGAQEVVAFMYANGFGTDTNYILAWVWIIISSTPHPEIDKGKIRRKLSARELAEAEDIAHQYIRRYQLR
ncbi:hypothetical protein ACMYSL_16945 [Klebsiella sp. MISC125]|uniref:J domain-containing protein n=1 Tax=Klebsiella sp. MISC125 TaxID=2755386 RepID=UPI003DA9CE12